MAKQINCLIILTMRDLSEDNIITGRKEIAKVKKNVKLENKEHEFFHASA
jgi:hypothetical protein